jgi:hypothetical protein
MWIVSTSLSAVFSKPSDSSPGFISKKFSRKILL